MIRALLARLRSTFRRRSHEAELDEELRYHLERDARAYEARGMAADRAGFAARRDFGRVDEVKESVRDTWGLRRLGELRQDIVFALRGFARAPLFVVVVVLTIAIGLGLNATVFTIFNSYVLRAAPVRDPGAVYALRWNRRAEFGYNFRWAEYEELRGDRRVLSDVFAYRWLYASMGDQVAVGQFVTGNYFRFLGVGAALGRTFEPDDDTGAPVVVLTHRAWRSRFASDSGIVGKRVAIRGYPAVVIGVARAGFDGIEDSPPDYWAPLATGHYFDDHLDLRSPNQAPSVEVVGRLSSGVTPAAAQSVLSPWIRRATADRPDTAQATGVALESRATAVRLTPELVLGLIPLLAGFGLVLLIACANVANMMLARGSARSREIGVRLALGAGRGRLVRQLLTESLLLALPAALVGFGLTRLTLGAGVGLLFRTMPARYAPYVKILSLGADLRVLVFMVAAAVVAAAAFGLAPALQATRPGIIQTTRGDFGLKPSRLRTILIVAQICTCTLLLVTAGVFVSGQKRLEALDIGFDQRGMINLDVNDRFRAQVLATLRARTDVRAVAATPNPPLEARLPPVSLRADGDSTAYAGRYALVSREIFDVLAVRLPRGRTFTLAEETGQSPVAVVSERLARRLWPGRDPIGQTIRVGPTAWWGRAGLTPFPIVRVVGVAPDLTTGWLGDGANDPVLYLPTPLATPSVTIVLRTTRGAEAALADIRNDLAVLDRGAVDRGWTTDEALAGNIYPFQVANWISTLVGGMALLLTLTGVYGVLSYLVAQRKREIGIRVALGARADAVVGLVLRQSARLALIGIGIGLVLAMGVALAAASALVAIDPFAPAAYGTAVGAVLVACLAAAYIPTRRAVSVDPVETLRHD